MDKTLICTVGLPYSGKSTWARSTLLPIVSPDAIRLAMHGERYLQAAEPMVWMLAEYMVAALFLAGHDKVILDATCNTRTRRQRWVSNNWKTEFIDMGTSAATCRGRARDVNDNKIIEVIDRMAEESEPLGDDEPVMR